MLNSRITERGLFAVVANKADHAVARRSAVLKTLRFCQSVSGSLAALWAVVVVPLGLGCNIGAQPELPDHPSAPIFGADDEARNEGAPIASPAPAAFETFIDGALVRAERALTGVRFLGLAGALQHHPDEPPDADLNGESPPESPVVYAVELGEARNAFLPADDGSFSVTLEREALPDTFEVIFTATRRGQRIREARFFVDLASGNLTPIFPDPEIPEIPEIPEDNDNGESDATRSGPEP